MEISKKVDGTGLLKFLEMKKKWKKCNLGLNLEYEYHFILECPLNNSLSKNI